MLSPRLADSRGTETVESVRTMGCLAGDTTGAGSVVPTAGAESPTTTVLGAWLLSVELDVLAAARGGVPGLTDETVEGVRACASVSTVARCSGVAEIRELSATGASVGGDPASTGREATSVGVAARRRG